MARRSVPSVIDLTGDDENTILASETLASDPNGMQDLSLALEKRRQDLLQAFLNSTPGNAEQNNTPKNAIGLRKRGRLRESGNGHELSLANGTSARQGNGGDRTEGTPSSNLPPPVPETCIAASGNKHPGQKETSGQAASQAELEKPSESTSPSQVFRAIRDVINIYRGVLSEDERRTMGAQIARKLITNGSSLSPKGQLSLPHEEQASYRKLAWIQARQMIQEKVNLSGNKQKMKKHSLSGTLTGHGLKNEHKRQLLNSSTSVQGKHSLTVHMEKQQGPRDNVPSDLVHHPLRLKRTSDGQVKASQEGFVHSAPPQDHMKLNLTKITTHENSFSRPPADVSRLRGEASSPQFFTQEPRVGNKQTSKVIAYPQVIIETPPRIPKDSSSALHKKQSPIPSRSSVTQSRISGLPSTLKPSFTSERGSLGSSTNPKATHSEVKTRKLDFSRSEDTASYFTPTSNLPTQHNRTLNKFERGHSSAGSNNSNYSHTRNQHPAGETASSVRGSSARESVETSASTSKDHPGSHVSLEPECEMTLPLPSSKRILRPRRVAGSARSQTSNSGRTVSPRPSLINMQGTATRKRQLSSSPEREQTDKRQKSKDEKKKHRSYRNAKEWIDFQNEPEKITYGSKRPIKLVDFTPMEMCAVLPSILKTRHLTSDPKCSSHHRLDCVECVRAHVLWSLKGVTEIEITEIITHVMEQPENKLGYLEKTNEHVKKRPGNKPVCIKRNEEDIRAFLIDASMNHLSSTPRYIELVPVRQPHPGTIATLALQRQVYLRQLGLDAVRHCHPSSKAVFEGLKTNVYDMLKLSRNWTIGGSSDVLSVMWSPDGNTFAAGCAALTDSHNMQYNRCNNLLLGSYSRNIVRELPDHRLTRMRPNSGPNAAVDMFNAMDPWLYYTVSSVEFSPNGRRMYTASYDRTVLVWDLEQETARGRLLNRLEHEDVVDIVSISNHYPNIIATASKTLEGSIRIYRIRSKPGSGTDPVRELSSAKAVKQAHKEIYPSCIRWGSHGSVAHLILAGFSSNVGDDWRPSRDGDLCIFDINQQNTIKVTPSAQNVFDCVWHPELPWYAVGCVADSHANRGIGSYVRLYQGANRATLELECPALDMNEITWCPDYYYCTASCTNGNTYVWDLRRHDQILHVLKHGDPIQELPASDEPWFVRKERYDTGVRFAHWGHSTDRFYTGSSDGVVKVWDIKRATEDTHVKDLVQLESGVMCGSFTKDHSKLLLGDTQGQLSVLTIELTDEENEDGRVGTFAFERSEMNNSAAGEEDPYEAAREMLRNKEIVIDDSHGLRQAIRGPNYNGPFADDAYAEELRRENENAERRFLAEKGKSGNGTKKADTMMKSAMINEDEDNELDHSEKVRNGVETTNIVGLDGDDEYMDDEVVNDEVVNDTMAGWPFPQELRSEYQFDCGIFSTQLLSTDVENNRQVGNDGGYAEPGTIEEKKQGVE